MHKDEFSGIINTKKTIFVQIVFLTRVAGGLIMRERILKAFIEEIRENGMKFTMDDLAKRLGISKRTLYEHFSSKVEILETIIEQTFSEVEHKTEIIVQDENLTILEKIKRVVTVMPTYVEFYDLRVFEQMKRYFPKQWETLHAELNDWEALRFLVEEGIRKGQLADMNVAFIMKLFIDAANSTLDRNFFMQNNISVPEALSSIVDVLLFGLVPENKR
ncbi:transcriptional regulator, TetR family [Aneurinibacillus aneurinilyticus ATCC 12856]|uniref:Transcriptional regulator, TetR family n=2 Tax=Aneurinibacillus aneurinilyticus TaxID=1391 RepID=U1WFN2_ANEAE|nr:transcriptional regulator, TetR family [Aneurinibacillus aneurinilyticus ATCC 12856]